jgi:hypothetical protein
MANNPNPQKTPAPQPPGNLTVARDSENAATVSPKPAPTPAKPAVEPIAESKPAVQPSTAASPTNSISARALAFVSPEVAGRPKSLLIAGVVLLLLAIILIVVMVRRSRTTSGSSLISHTMGNSGKK